MTVGRILVDWKTRKRTRRYLCAFVRTLRVNAYCAGVGARISRLDALVYVNADTQTDTIRESFPAFHIALVSTLGVSTLFDICQTAVNSFRALVHIFAQLQRFVELESRGAGFHPGHFQTLVTTLRVHAERLVGGAGSR